MKKFLVRFFQVLFLLQLAGHGPLNAQSLDRAPGMSAAPGTHLEWAEQTPVSLFHGYSPAPILQSYDNHHTKIVRLVSENIDEEADELQTLKKRAESALCPVTAFYTLLTEQYHNSLNSLAFCKQVAFLPATEKYLLFRDLRI